MISKRPFIIFCDQMSFLGVPLTGIVANSVMISVQRIAWRWIKLNTTFFQHVAYKHIEAENAQNFKHT